MSFIARGGSSPPSRTKSPRTSLGRWPGLFVFLALVVVVSPACKGPTDVVLAASEAAAAGDREAYVATFTPRSRPVLRALYAVADRTRPELAQLGSLGVRISGVEPMPYGLDGAQRLLITVTEGGRSLPLVLHGVAGTWRIDLMDSERALSGVGMGL